MELSTYLPPFDALKISYGWYYCVIDTRLGTIWNIIAAQLPCQRLYNGTFKTTIIYTKQGGIT